MDLAVVYDLKDGRVIRIRNYLDPADAIEAAGVSE
jgi:ketosteroid isomerase-like protein